MTTTDVSDAARDGGDLSPPVSSTLSSSSFPPAAAVDGGGSSLVKRSRTLARTKSVFKTFRRRATTIARRRGNGDGTDDPSRRVALVLHGWRSNASVSATHVSRLRLLARFERAHCVDGAVAANAAADDATAALFDGPWFSWVDAVRDGDLDGDTRALEEELVRSLRAVVKFTSQREPYECVVGFSQGGAVATLLSHPDVLQALGVPVGCALWKRAIIVCGGSSALITLTERALGLDLSSEAKTTSLVPSLHVFGFQDAFKPQGEELMKLFATASMDKSELIRHCVYFDGGHGVPAALKDDDAFHREIDAWMEIQSTPTVCERDEIISENASWDVVQDLNYRSEKLPKGQRASDTKQKTTDADAAERGEGEPAPTTIVTAYDTANALTFKKPPTVRTICTPSGSALSFDTNYASVATCVAETSTTSVTILEALRQAPRESPLLRSLDETQPPMTYGALLDFITNGDGDLRKISAKPNDVVAYNVPPGPVGAAAFLSIASQCTAVPLDPGIAEDDAYEALTSCGVTRVIIFRGTGSDAAEKAARRANISITWFAVSEDASRPAGTYAPEVSEEGSSSAQRLELRCDSIGLLLRTSGTTSKAKVVPLLVGALTSNGAALAKSLELTHKDVCINAMPLFHIGGLSCSILATIAAKASVICCMKFDAKAFYDAITSSTSRAPPTWYSAIPTIHITVLQYGKAVSGGSLPSHSLRFIRSGAAALSHADAEKLHDFWRAPVVPTYSMSEQMPISGKSINLPLHERADTVGQPLICSVALVSDGTCLPTAPFGQQGELVVSGDNVMRGYANAEEANNKTYLYIGDKRYLRTGDIAKVDADGFIYLTGRSKELIKRGGEQVSPLKVEAVLAQHPAVRVAVVFGVPSPLWGEEVGVAIVLVDSIKSDDDAILKSIKGLATSSKELSRFEVPAYWKIVADEDLPKTSTKKYKRAGLADILDMTKSANTRLACSMKNSGKPATTTAGLGGLRYCMAVGVMFNHIGAVWQGADEINPLTYGPAWWSAKATTFYFPATTFFVLGGFTLSAALYGKEVKKGTWLSFYNSRLQTLFPLYLVSLICGFANVLAVCRPETFSSEFSWQPHNDTITLASGAMAQCQTSPVEMPYGAWLFMTLVVFGLGLQTWFPAWLLSSWFMYYTWFNGVYYFIILVFPFMQNALARVKGDVRAITKWFAVYTFGVLVTGALLGVYYAFPAWEEHDELGKAKSWKENMQNIYALSTMMFPPYWVPCVGTGMAAYFWYDAVRPYQTHRKKLYGAVADGLTLAFIAFHIAHFCDIDWPYPTHVTGKMWQVTADEHHAWDTGIKRYVWSVMITRLYSPLIAVWIALLSMPQGSVTTRLLESNILTRTLAPTSYGCFLFHQIIGQWYWWITRSNVDVGRKHDWSWWAYPKEYYWFSPQPLPVAWYEFFFVVALVTAFSAFVDKALNARLTVLWIKGGQCFARLFGRAVDASAKSATGAVEASPEQSVLKAVAALTGVEDNVSLDDSFDEIGLVSVGLPVLVGLINAEERFTSLSPADIAGCADLRAVVDIVAKKRKYAESSAGVGIVIREI